MMRHPIRTAAALFALTPLTAQAQTPAPTAVVRVNQLGYLPTGPKVAVACALDSTPLPRFRVEDARGRVVQAARPTREAGAFGPCVRTWRLDFGAVRAPGRYRVVALGAAGDTLRVASPVVKIGADVYDGAADVLLAYMRQQRSGFNPFFRDSVHKRDGLIVDDSARAGQFVNVSGGWADAADYLQYVTTSANATFVMLMAYRDHDAAFGDAHDARGLAGRNGTPDVLDEARHGLEWLLAMFPSDSLMFNQLGDDRDHAFLDLPTTDSSDYGWGRGKERPVYPCTGRPQGLLRYRNRATGLASTAGKYASAMALGARVFATRDAAFAARLRERAVAAYALGRKHPGVCQTAPGSAPYFYEEDNWVDDMELGAAQLHALTGERRYLTEAMEYARQEPVTPWMGADTARHYQWYPWHNNGHHEVWRAKGATAAERREVAAFYRRGLEAVAKRAENGFRVGIPFIWCSNNLMASLATQAHLYRRMTGDGRFRELEAAALDWLFGANPWGVSMVINLPADGTWARDPHSVVAMQFGPTSQTGGLVDGPVYRSIYQNLRGIALHEPDEYAPFNTGHIVYHDDRGDYSTNEPIMDGTANLTYLLAAMTQETRVSGAVRRR
ncbi:glycoside hydrolase family 9 protein [Roseisolibacter agri]|uniref:Hydrolase n=1 Tax=Roseisolibacter agri TaxID=2014610 RepID=A0AA37V3J5_9BACT|nr:glycoside hydrolase family 9 protein [Roseisolibacter agri]GLC26847.1 hydrolase [Roseisolibacter agri]